MIRARFTVHRGRPTGFSVVGHSDAAQSGKDIVCAAVTSAVMLTANTISDVVKCGATVTVGDNSVTLAGCGSAEEQMILQGLLLHLQTLAQQNPANIKVIITEE